MSLVYFQDEKQRKAAPVWEYLTTQQNLHNIEAWARNTKNQAVLDMVAVIKNHCACFPANKANYSYSYNTETQNHTTAYMPQHQSQQLVFVVLSAGHFNMVLRTEDVVLEGNDVEQSLAFAEQVHQAVVGINKQLKLCQNSTVSQNAPPKNIHFLSTNALVRNKMLYKKMSAGELSIQPFTATSNLAHMESYVLFTKTKDQEGYLSPNANIGDLSKAKLYASVEEARRSMSNSSNASYRQVRVVKVGIAVEQVLDVVSSARQSSRETDLAQSSIERVAAELQHKKIVDALQQASEEQINQCWEARQNTRPQSKKKM